MDLVLSTIASAIELRFRLLDRFAHLIFTLAASSRSFTEVILEDACILVGVFRLSPEFERNHDDDDSAQV
ncbi:hypothetical protein NC981_12100 [Leptolyngbya sp. DQ-M1]